jgi:hypothetical protein
MLDPKFKVHVLVAKMVSVQFDSPTKRKSKSTVSVPMYGETGVWRNWTLGTRRVGTVTPAIMIEPGVLRSSGYTRDMVRSDGTMLDTVL